MSSNAQEVQLDQFNESLRSSQFYADWMRSHGIDTSRGIKLSGEQKKAFKRDLEAIGVQFQGDLEIDSAGNMNSDEGFGKQVKKWGPIVGGAAALAFGIPGLTPGLIGGIGGGAAAGTGAAAAGGGAGGFSFGSMLPSLISTGGGIAGSLIAGRGASKAADAQERAAREALDWEKTQYADEQSRLQPFRDMGGQAYNKLATQLGLTPNAAPTTPQAPTNPVDRLSFAQPRSVGAGQTPGAAAMPQGAPQPGQRRTFPNGRIGQWDGRGWMAVG